MGVLALICGNGFIVGLNQIYDVSIDQVNKPFLPIAAGDCTADCIFMTCPSSAHRHGCEEADVSGSQGHSHQNAILSPGINAAVLP